MTGSGNSPCSLPPGAAGEGRREGEGRPGARLREALLGSGRGAGVV